ncbi:MAG: SAM-dependent methyltransferase, partial [Candidatus Nanopelagicales bacterium]
MERALYGAQGFYRQGQRPDDHFRTSVHATPLFSSAITRLIVEVDTQLDHPDPFDVVDIGAGRAELLHSLLSSLPEQLVRRARFTAVEVVERPDDVDPTIAWTTALPTGINGVILANEWLDNIPVNVAERSDRGVAQVLVDEDGTESLGEAVSTGDQDWLVRWWPLTEDVGDRAEVGASR